MLKEPIQGQISMALLLRCDVRHNQTEKCTGLWLKYTEQTGLRLAKGWWLVVLVEFRPRVRG